jgi:NDP-sugar pyrophosphorylase family protein
MIFAAGLGTRLKPYTDQLPKALVPVAGIPMLERVIHRLKDAGVTSIIVNVHHFAGAILEFLKRNNNFNIEIEISDEQEQLLDTGGGLIKAAWFLRGDEPILLHNADIFSSIDLNKLLEYHLLKGGIATLAVQNRPSGRVFMVNKEGILHGWKNNHTGEEIKARPYPNPVNPVSFSGIQILSPNFLDLVKQNGVFSITNTYLKLAARYDIHTFDHSQDTWFDIGKPESLEAANRFIHPPGNGNFSTA